ncbi:GGDEF domain-containing protein [Yoonia sediminilitoris]|uniref:Diguanylate cyclase with GGDEF domain n=1 Tax=Yoonia sediminilitoris TaxID=1286148 RepID=A0A2T6KHF6_9RHOB|nr:diguanylate cyclase with GGDEF domain [Yoonia sediminilitoris]RCW95675.1 diguanylate cyclase with GGDEF domain [Yoonia sediminilitoris]
MGDEGFCVILRDAMHEAAIAKARVIRNGVIGVPFVFDGVPLPIAANFGISEPTLNYLKFDVVLRRADAALSQAKSTGRDPKLHVSCVSACAAIALFSGSSRPEFWRAVQYRG